MKKNVGGKECHCGPVKSTGVYGAGRDGTNEIFSY